MDAAARARARQPGARGAGFAGTAGAGVEAAVLRLSSVNVHSLAQRAFFLYSRVRGGGRSRALVGAGGLAPCGVVPLEQRVLPLRELRVVARAAFGQRDVEAGRRRARLRAPPREKVCRGPERRAHAPAQGFHAPGIRQVPPQRRVALRGLLAECLPWRAVGLY